MDILAWATVQFSDPLSSPLKECPCGFPKECLLQERQVRGAPNETYESVFAGFGFHVHTSCLGLLLCGIQHLPISAALTVPARKPALLLCPFVVLPVLRQAPLFPNGPLWELGVIQNGQKSIFGGGE